MAIDNYKIDDIRQLANSFQAKAQGTGNANFKGLFKDIFDKLQTLTSDFADGNKKQVEINGRMWDKSEPGTALIISNYISNLQNLNTLSLDILTKKGSFEDQVSKMIS